MTLTIETIGGTLGTPHETITPGSFAIGINLDGMEYGSAGAVANFNYAIPSLSELQYYKSQGLDLIRLPISWATLQTALNGPLTASYLSNIESVVNNAASVGIKVILDLHNFGGYEGNQLGSAAVTDADFANLWTKLASAFAGNPGIGGYDLMNEPNNMPSATAWTSAAQAAITAIRTVDTKTTIYVEGNNWSNSSSWSENNPGFAQLNDPSNNLVFSAHLYLDNNGSGTGYDWATEAAGGDTTQIGVQRLQDFVTWLKTNNFKGEIGELGVGNDNPAWLTALDNTLAYAKASNLQVTYWDAGPWLGAYPYSAEPTNGVNAPQMAVLDKYSGDYPTLAVASISGTTNPDAVVYLSENDVLLATVTANSAGVWTDTLKGLADGIHIIVAGDNLPTVDGTIAATVFDLVSGIAAPPVITAPAAVTIGVGTLTAIRGVSLSETGNTAGETFTVTLTDANGLLSATGNGITGSGTKALSVTGSLAQVNADLATLKDTDASTLSNTINLSTTDSLGNKATATVAVTANGLPIITHPATATVGVGTLTAISGVSLSETGTTAGETFAVTLTDANGLLSATGTGITGSGTKAMSVTGSLAQVNADLTTLKDTDASTLPNTINLSATDSLGNKAAAAVAVTVNGSVIGPGDNEILAYGATVSGAIEFAGSNATLSIAGPSAPSNTITGLDANGMNGDLIVLPGTAYMATDSVALDAANVLSVDLGGTVYKLQFDPTQSFVGDDFGIKANSQGQAVISMTAAAVGGTVIGPGDDAILAYSETVSGAIDFAGNNATLSIAGPSPPGNVITGFDANGATGDLIVVPGVAYTAADSVTLNTGNVLSVDLAGIVYKLQFDPSQSFAGHSFGIEAGSQGQVVIFDPPSGAAAPHSVDISAITSSSSSSPWSEMAFLNVKPHTNNASALWGGGKQADFSGQTNIQLPGRSFSMTQPIFSPSLGSVSPSHAGYSLPISVPDGRSETTWHVKLTALISHLG